MIEKFRFFFFHFSQTFDTEDISQSQLTFTNTEVKYAFVLAFEMLIETL
jgi:hypothetical protein